MCNVSVVGETYMQRLGDINPQWRFPFIPAVSRQEFDALHKEVLEMKKLLKLAKAEDERTGQTDCQHADKMDALRKIAALVGINLDDVIGNAATTPTP